MALQYTVRHSCGHQKKYIVVSEESALVGGIRKIIYHDDNGARVPDQSEICGQCDFRRHRRNAMNEITATWPLLEVNHSNRTFLPYAKAVRFSSIMDIDEEMDDFVEYVSSGIVDGNQYIPAVYTEFERMRRRVMRIHTVSSWQIIAKRQKMGWCNFAMIARHNAQAIFRPAQNPAPCESEAMTDREAAMYRKKLGSEHYTDLDLHSAEAIRCKIEGLLITEAARAGYYYRYKEKPKPNFSRYLAWLYLSKKSKMTIKNTAEEMES